MMIDLAISLLLANAPHLQTETFPVIVNDTKIFVAQDKDPSTPSINVPVIDNLTIQPVKTLKPGTKLIFRLQGTPKSKVSITLPTDKKNNVIPMKEVQKGVYIATYVVGKTDKFKQKPSNTFIRADLQNGERATTSTIQLNGAPALTSGQGVAN
jgi:hypothetical protein